MVLILYILCEDSGAGKKFISDFKNYPVLFIGTGMSLRYLKHSYTWDGLLNQIALDLTDSNEYYLDLKAHHYFEGNYVE